jgi:putative ABC transport system substrate-binding protein
MKRREFIALVGAAAAWPLGARPQQGDRVRRIGVLTWLAENDQPAVAHNAAFRDRLRELGWIEGRSLHIDFRWASGNSDLLTTYAEELVNLNPEVILAGVTTCAIALKRATKTIPIVVALVYDPVGLGLVSSQARPGGNVTGILSSVDSLPGKQIEILREAAPHVIKLGILINTANAQNPIQARDAETAAQKTPVKILRVEVQSPDALDLVFDTLVREGAQAALVLPDPMFSKERGRIAKLATARRLPTMYSENYNVEDGGLISYGYNRRENYRRAAAFVDKLLKGAKPADLPVELPSKLELAINLRTAKALRLTIPPALLARADEVIE